MLLELKMESSLKPNDLFDDRIIDTDLFNREFKINSLYKKDFELTFKLDVPGWFADDYYLFKLSEPAFDVKKIVLTIKELKIEKIEIDINPLKTKKGEELNKIIEYIEISPIFLHSSTYRLVDSDPKKVKDRIYGFIVSKLSNYEQQKS